MPKKNKHKNIIRKERNSSAQNKGITQSNKMLGGKSSKPLQRKLLRGSAIRKLLKNKIFLITVFLGCITLAIYLLDSSHRQQFVLSLSNFNSVDFKEIYRNDKATSPLCGCLNDSVPHDGIMIPAKRCKIKVNKDKDSLSNFLITCPDEDVIGPGAGYSFDTKIYRFKQYKYQEMEMAEIASYIEKNNPDTVSHNFENQPFISIVTAKDIEIYASDPNCILTFIGSVKGTTSLQKVFDKYEGDLNQIVITNKTKLGKGDTLNKVPAMDFHSDKLYIRWVDSIEILSPKGSSRSTDELRESYSKDVKKKPVTESYKDIIVNIAVIKPKNDLRISVLPWTSETSRQWEFDYLIQFPKPGDYLYINNIPIINRKTLEPINFKNIKPFRTPNDYEGSSDLSVEITNIMKDSSYNSLYNKYVKEGGYYYNYDDDDYEEINKIELDSAIIDSNVVKNHLLTRGTDSTTDAHILLERQKKLLGAFDMSKSKTVRKDTMKLDAIRGYFRYPPLHKEEGISFYNKFSFLKLSECDGILQINNNKISLNNQIVEFKDLQNVEYEYPSLFTGIGDNSKKTIIKGEGKIKVDGHVISESLLENRYLLMLSTLATLISFVITMFTLVKNKPKSI